MEGEGSLTRGFRSVDFDDTATGETAYAQSHVQLDTAGGDNGDIFVGLIAQSHDRTLSIILFNLCDGSFYCLCLICGKVAESVDTVCVRLLSHN